MACRPDVPSPTIVANRSLSHRRLIKGACWIGIVVWLAIAALIAIGDPSTLWQMAFLTFIPLGFLGSMLGGL